MARSLTSEQARDMLIVPQLQELMSERQVEQWKFPPEAVDLCTKLIEDLESGKYLP